MTQAVGEVFAMTEVSTGALSRVDFLLPFPQVRACIGPLFLSHL